MSFVEDAMAKLTKAGYKMTQRRRDILAVFEEDEEYFKSAKNVQERLEYRYPGLSFDTIYRNLKLFTDEHFLEVQEINGENFYRKHCDPKIGHHHHFICENCGKSVPLKLCLVDEYTKQLPGYRIIRHSFELTGLCPNCIKIKKS